MAVAGMADAEEGAPIPPDAIDPELVKLRRARPKVGIITSAGIVFLCAVFLVKLGPDRGFAREPSAPARATVADVTADKLAIDSFVTVDAQPMMAHAARAGKSKGDVGLRVVPVRGGADRLWLVLDGDGFTPPAIDGYAGRLRRLSSLPFDDEVRELVAGQPRPMFASAAAIRAGIASGKIATITGDAITPRDTDRVAFDVIDPEASRIFASLTANESLPTADAWRKMLVDAGITPTGSSTPEGTVGEVRFDVPLSTTATMQKLEAGKLFAARVESVTHHHETTWGALRGSSPSGFVVGTQTIPDAQVDVIGVYITRPIPEDAYALITGEHPDDYWYVMPITIALVVIGLVFAWALFRSIKREFSGVYFGRAGRGQDSPETPAAADRS
jgi:hypothetical protein